MRLGIIRVSFGLLEQVLHLPEGHRVRAVRDFEGGLDTFEVCVEGPTLVDVKPGDTTPVVQYQVSVEITDDLEMKKTFTGKFLTK